MFVAFVAAIVHAVNVDSVVTLSAVSCFLWGRLSRRCSHVFLVVQL